LVEETGRLWKPPTWCKSWSLTIWSVSHFITFKCNVSSHWPITWWFSVRSPLTLQMFDFNVNCYINRKYIQSYCIKESKSCNAISAYHNWFCEFESRSGWSVEHYVIMNLLVSWTKNLILIIRCCLICLF
jgi:hypothetical protein